MKHKSIMAATLSAALLVPLGAAAHHSFAVFFDESRNVRVEGVVTAFRFTNPHATIVLDVVASDGQTHEWRMETNAPVVLQRRGWNRNSLKAGDRVTLDGWPSRDGRLYMRLRAATDANGRAIGGAPFSANDD